MVAGLYVGHLGVFFGTFCLVFGCTMVPGTRGIDTMGKKVPCVEIQDMQVGKRGVFGAQGVEVLCECLILLKVTYVTYFDALITNRGLDRSETPY